VTIYDPQGLYTAQVTDAGQLSTTATLTGSVTVGNITFNGPQPISFPDASVQVSNFPNTQAVSIAAAPLIPAAYATPSQWFDASAGTIKEAGATVYSLACSNSNTYPVRIQIYQSPSPPVADATAYLDVAWVPANGGVTVLGADFFTQAGLTIPTDFSWGASQVTHWYSAAGPAGITCTWLYQ
jgi:hypothetical protein